MIRDGKQVKMMLEGLNDLRRKILSLLGNSVARIYQINPSFSRGLCRKIVAPFKTECIFIILGQALSRVLKARG